MKQKPRKRKKQNVVELYRVEREEGSPQEKKQRHTREGKAATSTLAWRKLESPTKREREQ